MNTREKFINWMVSNSERSNNTINKYASAISIIFRELELNGMYDADIYKIIDPSEIDKIKEQYLKIDYLRKKDERGNRMYTSSLAWYKKYLEAHLILNTLAKDSLNEYSIIYLKKEKGEFIINEGIKQWKRDRSVVDRVIQFSDSKCEYDNRHEYFISNKSEKNYVEGHHFIPMKYQDNFNYSLDVEANVVSLCVVCHKILHLGKLEDKVKILSKIYDLRKELLKLSGIEISLDNLIDIYR